MAELIIPSLIKNSIKTDTFQLFTKHRIAGGLFNIPLMYDPVLWNRFLIEKKMVKLPGCSSVGGASSCSWPTTTKKKSVNTGRGG